MTVSTVAPTALAPRQAAVPAAPHVHHAIVEPAAFAPRQAASYVGFSLPTFWRTAKNDASFPKVFKVSPGRCAVMRAELDAWLAAKREAVQ